MATLKLYLDTRRMTKDGAPLKLRISKKSKTVLFSLDIKINPNNWDADCCKVINAPRKKALNDVIETRLYELRKRIYEIESVCPGISAKDIAMKLSMSDGGGFNPDMLVLPRIRSYAANARSPRTGDLYLATLKRMLEYMPDAESLTFDDINVGWLRGFDSYLAKTSGSKNARNIHLRNIRTVFNAAIDDEITTSYPFRRFKIRPEATRKRSMPVETLRRIFDAETLDDWEIKYRDFFKLSFMLIGINVVDLCQLTEMVDGRINYTRAKTHKPYSIKVEPEILSLIERYKGEKQLLSFIDGYANYRRFYMNLCNGLKSIKTKLGLNELSTYWARHTWATIAADLDIPDAVISQALGHAASNSTTEIYIRRNQRKVDEANRRVLDWVLYGKRD